MEEYSGFISRREDKVWQNFPEQMQIDQAAHYKLSARYADKYLPASRVSPADLTQYKYKEIFAQKLGEISGPVRQFIRESDNYCMEDKRERKIPYRLFLTSLFGFAGMTLAIFARSRL